MGNTFDPDVFLSKKSAFDPDAFLGVASNVSANNADVPGMEGEAIISDAQKTDRSIGDIAEGVGEAALTIATGAALGAPAYLVGAIPDAIDQLAGNPDRKYRESFPEAVTNTPESEAGQEYVKGIGEMLGALPPVMGSTPVVGLNTIKGKPRFPKINNPLARKIADESEGKVQKSFTKKLGNDRFTPRVYNMVREARKQGFDDDMTTMMANASPIDKRAHLKMVNVAEKGLRDPKFRAEFRPSDIPGDSLLKQISFIKSNNDKAGKQLGKISKGMNKQIDVSEPINGFIKNLDDIGVKMNADGVPEFEGSLIEFSGPAKTLVNNTLTKIQRKKTQPTGLEAHEFKKFLDEDLSHGKKQEGGVSGKVQRIFGDLRRGINESIGSEYPKYKEANKRFSDTITALDSLQDVVGKKLNFNGPNADKATGTALRSLMNNTKGRANLIDAVNNIQETANKYGGSFSDDILEQMLVADELESVITGGGRTSLRGEVGKGNVDAAIDISQMTLPGAAAAGAKALNKKWRGVNQENQIKSLKKLLGAKGK